MNWNPITILTGVMGAIFTSFGAGCLLAGWIVGLGSLIGGLAVLGLFAMMWYADTL